MMQEDRIEKLSKEWVASYWLYGVWGRKRQNYFVRDVSYDDIGQIPLTFIHKITIGIRVCL